MSREQAGPGAEHRECRSARAGASGPAGQGSGQGGQVGSFSLKSPGPCVPCKPLYSVWCEMTQETSKWVSTSAEQAARPSWPLSLLFPLHHPFPLVPGTLSCHAGFCQPTQNVILQVFNMCICQAQPLTSVISPDCCPQPWGQAKISLPGAAHQTAAEGTATPPSLGFHQAMHWRFWMGSTGGTWTTLEQSSQSS